MTTKTPATGRLKTPGGPITGVTVRNGTVATTEPEITVRRTTESLPMASGAPTTTPIIGLTQPPGPIPSSQLLDGPPGAVRGPEREVVPANLVRYGTADTPPAATAPGSARAAPSSSRPADSRSVALGRLSRSSQAGPTTGLGPLRLHSFLAFGWRRLFRSAMWPAYRRSVPRSQRLWKVSRF